MTNLLFLPACDGRSLLNSAMRTDRSGGFQPPMLMIGCCQHIGGWKPPLPNTVG